MGAGRTTPAARGPGSEQPLVERIASLTGAPALLAAHAVLTALQHLCVKRLALGTPYPESISRLGRAYWEAAGLQVVGYHRLAGVQDIYSESEERADLLARQANVPAAEAVLLSGTGFPPSPCSRSSSATSASR
jgi:maleate isomerase